jgi:hypothetical protein
LCNGVGTACQCNPFASTTFTVSTNIAWPPPANSMGWIIGALFEVDVTLTPLDLDGTPMNQFTLNHVVRFDSTTSMSQTITLLGCTHKVRVDRAYKYLNPPGPDTGCTVTDTVDRDTIMIPAPTPLQISTPPPFTNACTAPPL